MYNAKLGAYSGLCTYCSAFSKPPHLDVIPSSSGGSCVKRHQAAQHEPGSFLIGVQQIDREDQKLKKGAPANLKLCPVLRSLVSIRDSSIPSMTATLATPTQPCSRIDGTWKGSYFTREECRRPALEEHKPFCKSQQTFETLPDGRGTCCNTSEQTVSESSRTSLSLTAPSSSAKRGAIWGSVIVIFRGLFSAFRENLEGMVSMPRFQSYCYVSRARTVDFDRQVVSIFGALEGVC